jgi:hypothetical protein
MDELISNTGYPLKKIPAAAERRAGVLIIFRSGPSPLRKKG